MLALLFALVVLPGARANDVGPLPPPPPPTPVSVRDVETNVPTVLAVSAAVYTSAALLHEGFGHQMGCWAAGRRPIGFSTANAGCDPDTPLLDAMGGALFGNGLGALATGIPLLLEPPKDGATYYAFWLHTLVNVQQIGGYMLVGPWLPVGDWGDAGVLASVRPRQRLPWRIGLSAVGLGITAASIPLAHGLGRPLFGDDMKAGQARRRLLTWVPWLAGSSLIVGSALLNRAGPQFAISSGIANFAGTLFLAYLPVFFADDAFAPKRQKTLRSGPPTRVLPIRKRPAWWVIGGIAAVGAVLVFGPGVGRYDEPHPFVPR
jgi:hypothetical protein